MESDTWAMAADGDREGSKESGHLIVSKTKVIHAEREDLYVTEKSVYYWRDIAPLTIFL